MEQRGHGNWPGSGVSVVLLGIPDSRDLGRAMAWRGVAWRGMGMGWAWAGAGVGVGVSGCGFSASWSRISGGCWRR